MTKNKENGSLLIINITTLSKILNLILVNIPMTDVFFNHNENLKCLLILYSTNTAIKIRDFYGKYFSRRLYSHLNGINTISMQITRDL